ncbi:MAG: DNA gyrase inhibitor YacG [Rhodobacteraceae bacterium]|nr:DNA gyrase inhibitor YacG [Paracoccaceae bacterium]
MSRPCPICGRPAVEGHRPFCSRRCADIDLHRWLCGRYAIPAAAGDEGGAGAATDGRREGEE